MRKYVDRVRTVRGGRTGDVWTLAEAGVSVAFKTWLPVPAHRLGALFEGYVMIKVANGHGSAVKTEGSCATACSARPILSCKQYAFLVHTSRFIEV
jgi:hypothetical protein